MNGKALKLLIEFNQKSSFKTTVDSASELYKDKFYSINFASANLFKNAQRSD